MHRAYLLSRALVVAAFALSACGGSASPPSAGSGELEANLSEDTAPNEAASLEDGGSACAAWDARYEGECRAELGSTWNGSSCVTLFGCACVGADCDKVSAGTCEAAAEMCASTATNICDKRLIGCRMAEPECPEGQTASVVIVGGGPAGCYGPCVDVTSCRCDPSEGSKDCPDDHACWGTHLACGPLVR
jgi:hypothetical protein